MLKHFLPAVQHLHFKDWNGGPSMAGYCALGLGKVDLVGVLLLLLFVLVLGGLRGLLGLALGGRGIAWVDCLGLVGDVPRVGLQDRRGVLRGLNRPVVAVGAFLTLAGRVVGRGVEAVAALAETAKSSGVLMSGTTKSVPPPNDPVVSAHKARRIRLPLPGGSKTVQVKLTVEQAGEADWLSVYADADELTPYPDDARIGDRAVLAIAGHVGKTRLIDNVVLGEDRIDRQ